VGKETDLATVHDAVTLTLDRSVALVIFDFLSRTTDEDEGELLADALESKAELPALWSLLAELEDVLTEPFADQYRSLVEAARVDVIKRFGKS
jgi:hypothetical protein